LRLVRALRLHLLTQLKTAVINLKLAAGATNLQDPTCNKDCGWVPKCAGGCRSHRPCCIGTMSCHVTECDQMKWNVDPVSGYQCSQGPGTEDDDKFDDICSGQTDAQAGLSLHGCQ